MKYIATVLSGLCLASVAALSAEVHVGTLSGSVPAVSWNEQRNHQVVRQNLDYSCGAASLATILRHHYQLEVGEAEVLQELVNLGLKLNKNKFDKLIGYSFEDLARVAASFGFRAGGVALNFDDLLKLRLPAIAFLSYRGEDHFTVVRGVAPDGTVYVADPSWGNRRFTAAQFKQMWETRPDQNAPGKLLLVLPESEANKINSGFFAPPKSLSALFESQSLGRIAR